MAGDRRAPRRPLRVLLLDRLRAASYHQRSGRRRSADGRATAIQNAPGLYKVQVVARSLQIPRSPVVRDIDAPDRSPSATRAFSFRCAPKTERQPFFAAA